jgi:hypothetical protein
MIFPTDAQPWVGKLVVLDWNIALAGTARNMPTNSGGRVLRVDETYLYLQPFGLVTPSQAGDPVTRLSLKIEEEVIPLVDIQTIYPAPLEGIVIDE